jgi:hypothetical protein
MSNETTTQSNASVNNNTPPNPNSSTANRLGVFGGESAGFARGLESSTAKSFYTERAVADQFGVAVGMNSEIPRSIFQKYALFNFRGLYGGLEGGGVFNDYTDSPDNKAMGGSNSKNVSISKLIEYYNTNYPRIGYTAADFLYCKYYKKIPVNHLITLRRFPTAVNDNIFDLTASPASDDPETAIPKAAVDATQTAGVTAITYMGEMAGNKLDDILKMSYGLNYEEVKSEIDPISSGDGGYTSQPFYTKMTGVGGAVGKATVDTLKGITARQKFASGNMSTSDKLGTTYANFVIGPVNVIDSTMIRQRGMKFQNDLKLNFEYELKSLNYINPKIAMIDIISNMLTMTYNNGQFFGGGQRYYGGAGAVASQFGDINKLKQGDFKGYGTSVVESVSKGFNNVFGGGTGEFNVNNVGEGFFKVGTTVLGNMLGGFLSSQVGAISGTQATKALISGEPTGDWHVTVGNPLNPIVTMGNMYCDNSTMTLGQGLGYDDFPMEVKFEIDLKHGKPRDKGDIENMFNAGRGRIYASAQGEEDILNLAGLDIHTPGSYRGEGSGNFEKGMSSTQGAQVSDVKNDQISNIKKQPTADTTSDTGSYISNLVSMTVDS